jgi:hypothetical protein
LGVGVKDFFYEPVQGFVSAPEDFGRGLGQGLKRGTTSLVKNSVYGIFNTASKISGSVGKGLATLAMDEGYLREREIRSRYKPKTVGEGIALGIRDLSVDIYHGVTGVVVRRNGGWEERWIMKKRKYNSIIFFVTFNRANRCVEQRMLV